MTAFAEKFFVAVSGSRPDGTAEHPIRVAIHVRSGKRLMVEGTPFLPNMPRLDHIQTIYPERHDNHIYLLDACLVFLPTHFAGLPLGSPFSVCRGGRLTKPSR